MDFIPTTVAGLPIHPLVVHFAVVLLPLAAFSTIVSIYIPRYRKGFAFASVFGLFFGTGAAIVAKQTGEKLAAQIGVPQNHSNYGSYLQIAAIVLFLLGLVWYRSFKSKPTIRARGIGHLTALVATAVLVLTFLTGHTGAEAVWKNRLPKSETSASGTNPTNSSSAPTATTSATPKPNASTKTSGTKKYSLKDVAKHSSSTSCWSAIDGNVYDLTNWINRHPGGAAVIKAICGKDGSASFNGQHSGQRRPADELKNYLLGALS